jgi:hypothetical protein
VKRFLAAVRRDRRYLAVRAVETAALAYVIVAARAWWAPVALALLLVVIALAVALAATRVRLREITAHDERQYLYLLHAGLGSDFAAGEDDLAARARVGRRP